MICSISDNSIDTILTDPPYAISKDSGYVNNSADRKDYIAKYGKHKIDFGEWDRENINIEALLSQYYRVLKPTGTLIMFFDVWKMGDIKKVAEKIGFKQPRLGCWQKTKSLK